MAPKILAFAGSARRESLNRKLIKVAAEALRSKGIDVTLVELSEYPMPLYNGDLEAESGLPEHARRLRAVAKEHHGYLIASPEYNSGYTGLLKNTIDWLSRGESGGTLDLFEGKTAALLSASPGALGGMRSLLQLRWVLENIGTLVLPTLVSVPRAPTVFGPDGELTDAGMAKRIDGQATAYAALLKRLS